MHFGSVYDGGRDPVPWNTEGESEAGKNRLQRRLEGRMKTWRLDKMVFLCIWTTRGNGHIIAFNISIWLRALDKMDFQNWILGHC